MKRIYLDYAAATPLDPKVKREMAKIEKEFWANTSSIHQEGIAANKKLEEARKIVAAVLGCKSSEIIFTSGGTEANNLALFGLARALKEKGRHIISTKIEHPSVLESLGVLEREGFEITYLPLDRFGQVTIEQLKRSVRPETILVSIGYVCGEFGTIQNIKELSGALKTLNANALFHTDAAQAIFQELKPKSAGVDAMTLNANKFYGPRGVGCLFLRQSLRPEPILHGGGQERGLRSGTSSVALIWGLARALEIWVKARDKENQRLRSLQQEFIDNVLSSIPGTILVGHPKQRSVHNVMFSFKNADGEKLVIDLDRQGIACATGSACTSLKIGPTEAIEAIGLEKGFKDGTLRFTLGRSTTRGEITKTINILKKVAI